MVSISRRAFLAAPVALAGCASPDKLSPFWATMVAPFRELPPSYSPEYVEKLPYASMQAWFEGAPKALLVLGSFDADKKLIWHSATKQVLATFGPFVVKAIGTDVELRGTLLSGRWSEDLREMIGTRVDRTLDLYGEGRASIAVRSEFRIDKLEDVEILGKVRRLQRIEERAVAARRFKFTNRYWIDRATGFCWKSRQLIAPTMPHLNIEVTKAPRIPSSA